jgi:hypothetical protein
MDAIESGRSFTVTRDGHEIGELIPLRRHRRFVSSQPTRKVGWAGGTRTSGRAGQAS